MADGWDAGANVEELPDAGVDQELDRASQKGAVDPRRLSDLWVRGDHLFCHLAIGREVVRPTEQVIVHARRARALGVDAGGHPFVGLHDDPSVTHGQDGNSQPHDRPCGQHRVQVRPRLADQIEPHERT
jgi:hypothetical protein